MFLKLPFFFQNYIKHHKGSYHSHIITFHFTLSQVFKVLQTFFLSLSFAIAKQNQNPLSLFINLSSMDQQEANALQFLREHLEEERRAKGQVAEGTSLEIPVTEVVTRMNSSVKYALAENHILRHGVAVHCITQASELTVLKESLIDFENLTAHGFDLWADVVEQGWENFFTRLHGPIYEDLVKDFWR